ncbi:MAG TPA: hypothetical protein VFW13_05245 [Phenylobacterium sp.]|nr:hypothetical protein [Phenylobacterium sp.]
MPRNSIVVVAAAAFGALAVSLAEAAPPSSHELALRSLIDSAVRGQLDEQAMTPELAAAVRPQMAIARRELVALGALRSVEFERIDQRGSEIYLTTFEHGSLEWAFSVAADGRIANAMYRKPLAPAR